jgi:hypothetical protein
MNTLTVDLVDGRTVSVPLAWYRGSPTELPLTNTNWRLIGRGEGIHWVDLDEEISVESLLAGRASSESQSSLSSGCKVVDELANSRLHFVASLSGYPCLAAVVASLRSRQFVLLLACLAFW